MTRRSAAPRRLTRHAAPRRSRAATRRGARVRGGVDSRRARGRRRAVFALAAPAVHARQLRAFGTDDRVVGRAGQRQPCVCEPARESAVQEQQAAAGHVFPRTSGQRRRQQLGRLRVRRGTGSWADAVQRRRRRHGACGPARRRSARRGAAQPGRGRDHAAGQRQLRRGGAEPAGAAAAALLAAQARRHLAHQLAVRSAHRRGVAALGRGARRCALPARQPAPRAHAGAAVHRGLCRRALLPRLHPIRGAPWCMRACFALRWS